MVRDALSSETESQKLLEIEITYDWRLIGSIWLFPILRHSLGSQGLDEILIDSI